MYAAYHTRRITQPWTDSQHTRVLYSPNLHQLFNLTWSTHVTWWFVPLTYISCLKRNGVVHLTTPRCATFTKHTPVQLFILTWSMNVAWLYVLDLHFTLEWHWLKEIATQPVRILLRCHFLILPFSLYAPITSDECHAWVYLYAASPGARNTEQAKIPKWKILVHVRIRTLTGMVTSLQVHRLNHTAKKIDCYK